MTDKDLSQQHVTEGGKSSYEPPAIEAIGTIEELTLGSTGSSSDFKIGLGPSEMISRITQ